MTTHNFRVVHFSTGHTGGAGLAARRLNYALRSKGLNSSFYALEQSDFKSESGEYSIRRNVFRKIASYLALLLQSQFSKKVLFSTISTNAISYSGGLFHNWGKVSYNAFSHTTGIPITVWAILYSGTNILQTSITARNNRISYQSDS